MSVVKIIEVVGSSPESSDAAVQAALSDARTNLRNIKAVDVVSTGLRGDNLEEWRAHVRIAFLVERVSE
ncbi:MAG TPA: dodecin family protein [Solirubrobacteraceae bacterium]|nr:dodecin family protein [Solirubrobacteraceae bacterium]